MAFHAIYPRAIPDFTTKRNVIDDVDASDVNLIQRELKAIAATLGVDPHVAYDVSLPPQIVTAQPGDDEVLIENYNPARVPATPGVQVIDYGTVSNRLDALEKGRVSGPDAPPASTGSHVFRLSYVPAGDRVPMPYVAIDEVVNTNTALHRAVGYAIRFPRTQQTTADDPFGYYNGTGVTLRKSGFWTFDATLVVTGVLYDLYGEFSATIVKQGSTNYADGQDLEFRSLTNKHTGDTHLRNLVLNPRLSGWFNAGDVFTLHTKHGMPANDDAGRDQVRISRANFTGGLVRESTTPGAGTSIPVSPTPVSTPPNWDDD